MRDLLLMYTESPDAPEPPAEALVARDAWVEKMERRRVRMIGDRLRLPAEMMTVRVRVRNDEAILTDGPFVKTREQIGCFELLDCADLDGAIGIAEKHPAARRGVIEIRPLRTS